MKHLLSSALGSWPDWDIPLQSEPVVLKKLDGGCTNNSYLLSAIALRSGLPRRFVLRFHNIRSSAIGIDRQAEKYILNALTVTNIAPKLYYLAESLDYSVLEYIDGRVWNKYDFCDNKKITALKKIVDTYQSVNLVLDDFSYEQCLSSYWKIFRKKAPNKAYECRKRFESFMSELKTLHFDRSLSHHDLRPENIIDSGPSIRIIDWEYAGLGYKKFDQILLNSHQSRKKNKPYEDRLILELIYWLDVLWWAIR